MQKKRDSTPVKQLELELEVTEDASSVAQSSVLGNVIRVQFGTRKPSHLSDSPKERALVERILQSAQRLNW